MFHQEAAGVFSVASRFVEGKNGIVVGRRGALAIDGSNYEDEGQAMADFIRRQGHDPLRLMLTHGHGDHILGAGPLAGGEVFAHRLTPQVIDRQVPGWAQRWGLAQEQARRRVVRPTVLFDDQLWIDLGDKHVWLLPTPGHSDDGVSAYVEEDRLLFAGDAVVNGIVAAIGDGDSRILEASLGKLAQLDIEVLVPGHGATMRGAGAVRDWLEWQGGYLAAVRQRVREVLSGGGSGPEAVNKVDFNEFIAGRLPADKHGMPKRHRNTVIKIAHEVARELGRHIEV